MLEVKESEKVANFLRFDNDDTKKIGRRHFVSLSESLWTTPWSEILPNYCLKLVKLICKYM